MYDQRNAIVNSMMNAAPTSGTFTPQAPFLTPAPMQPGFGQPPQLPPTPGTSMLGTSPTAGASPQPQMPLGAQY